MGYFRNADGSMSCSDHGVDFKPPFGCPTCAAGTARHADDEGGDDDLRSAIADGLPTLRDHERECNAIADEAAKLCRANSDISVGPAYLRIRLSARIAAATMADNRERRAWILEVERARKKSGSTAASVQPARVVAPVGDTTRRGVH